MIIVPLRYNQRERIEDDNKLFVEREDRMIRVNPQGGRVPTLGEYE